MRDQEFLDKQSFIIEATIALEYSLNIILYNDINLHRSTIKDIKETKVFKNSSMVPIKTKIDLLYDLNYFEKETYNSLIKQTEIRNIFAHNYSIESYLDCYKILAGKNILQEAYPLLRKTLSEENIEIAINNLFKDNISRLKFAIQEKNDFMLKTKKIHDTYNFLLVNHPETLIKTITQLELGNNTTALTFIKNKLSEYESFLLKIEH